MKITNVLIHTNRYWRLFIKKYVEMKSNRGKINISESTLNKIISESIKRRLSEAVGEEETLDRYETVCELKQLCQKYHLNFLDLLDDGEFGVASKIDPETKEEMGDLDGFEHYMAHYEELGMVEKTMDKTYLKFGAFVIRYKILANLV